jgi:hypothetical protein
MVIIPVRIDHKVVPQKERTPRFPLIGRQGDASTITSKERCTATNSQPYLGRNGEQRASCPIKQ